MIRRAWHGVVRFLASTRLAIGLLLFVGVWAMVATAVPQGQASALEGTTWVASHPLVEPVVRALGLHQAFTAPLFMACVLLLGLSTAVCSWQRTKVAIGRARRLRRAAALERRSLAETHDVEIACDPALSSSEVLSIASETLARVGMPTRCRDGVLNAVSGGARCSTGRSSRSGWRSSSAPFSAPTG